MVDRSDIDDDVDEPMASQSVDSEAPLTHNSSKNNFFASPDETPGPMIGQGAPRGSFKNTVITTKKMHHFYYYFDMIYFYQQQGKFNPQYMKGSPHSSQRGGKRSQTPDHMLGPGDPSGGVEMKPLHQVQTSMAAGGVHSPSVAQKVSRMGVPTPFAGVTSVPSPIRFVQACHFNLFHTFWLKFAHFHSRYSHPTVTSGARPEYISLAQQQSMLSRPYDQHDMSKSYSPGTMYGQATSPGRR